MSVIPINKDGTSPSVVTQSKDFKLDGKAVLILDAEDAQLAPRDHESNSSYDLRVGDQYRDHRKNRPIESLTNDEDVISLLPGAAAIIVTKEAVHFPTTIFGHILPKVSLLQNGIANTPSKVDPGYDGNLLITVFNHGKQTVPLKKGDPFCTLYLMSVEPAARPYDKPGKQLQGPGKRRLWRRWYDWIAAHPVILNTILAIAAIVSAIVSVVSVSHQR